MAGKSKGMVVTLDPFTTENVKWYESTFGRDPHDIVNGIMAGEINIIHETFSEKSWRCWDDTANVADQNIAAAITRRRKGAQVRRNAAINARAGALG